MRQIIFLLTVTFVWSNALAQEHSACNNLGFMQKNQTSKQLRNIAASCSTESIAQLYYNRAYHMDLLQEGETLSQIVAFVGGNITQHIESYRLYIALIELFAPQWYPNTQDRAAFLNREYDRRSEVAELRLHGYDRIADLKEKQFLSH